MANNIHNFPRSHEIEFKEAIEKYAHNPDAALAAAKRLINADYYHAYTLAGLIHEHRHEYEEAFFYYKRAIATVGALVSWYGVARLNLNGWGVPQNFAEAKRCYEIACKDADDGFGWLMLGAMYRLGLGVECDLKVAKECLIKAADKGYVLAYREIGLIEQSEAKKAKGYLYRFKAGILALGISLRNRKDIRLRFDYWPNNPR